MAKSVDWDFLKNFYNNYYSKKQADLEKCKDAINGWNVFRQKIVEGKLTLEEYVYENDNSLVKFLCSKTDAFATINSYAKTPQWMIKKEDADNYIALKKDGSIEKCNKTKAEKHFKSNVLVLLQLIIHGFDKDSNIDNLEKIQNDPLYKAFPDRSSGLLQKIMVIESAREGCCENLRYKLPVMTAASAINKLYNKLIGGSASSTVRKAFDIMTESYERLLTGTSMENQKKISDMLFDYQDNTILDISRESPNVIYYGSPGTGKTHTVKKGLTLMTAGHYKERVIWVQCHPGFGYEEFIEGLKPVGLTDKGTIKLEVVNGHFKDLCIKAKNDPDNEYFFVADEINRANLSAMFGETLSLLETDYRDDPAKPDEREDKLISTPLSTLIEAYVNDKLSEEISENGSEKEWTKDKIDKTAYYWEAEEGTENTPKKIKNVKFGVPENIRFIGMMNDVDKSIDAFDLALRRRFKWIPMGFDPDVLERVLSDAGIDEDDIKKYCANCKALNKFISQNDNDGLGFGKAYEFGHAYFMRIKDICRKSKDGEAKTITKKNCKKLFVEHLKPVLTEYIRSFKDENEIDGLVEKAGDYFLDPEYIKLVNSLKKFKIEEGKKQFLDGCKALNKFVSEELGTFEFTADDFLDTEASWTKKQKGSKTSYTISGKNCRDIFNKLLEKLPAEISADKKAEIKDEAFKKFIEPFSEKNTLSAGSDDKTEEDGGNDDSDDV